MSINTSRMQRRKRRVSSQIHGTEARPRICIYRSNKYIYAQAIDDVGRHTVAAISTKLGIGLKSDSKDIKKVKKSEAAKEAGKGLAKLLLSQKITAGVFDRGRYAYGGRVKMLAEGLREGGLKI